jgi:hypothetical protein
MGLFQGNIGQIASRFTFESTQSGAGYVFSGIHNIFGGVKSVTYYGGATAVESYSPTIFNGGGFTLGSYINGREDLQANPNNTLFQHEYGHYLQSQHSGFLYISKYAIPSLLSTLDGGDHDSSAAEQDANIRAFTYFNQKVGEGNFIWNDFSNPIIGYNFNNPYNHPLNQLALSNGLIGGGSFLNNFISFFDNFRAGVLNYYKYKR